MSGPVSNPPGRALIFGHPSHDRAYVARAREAAIHVGITLLFVIACLLILRPFLALITWGVIIAVASYPGFRRLQSLLGVGGGVAAVLCTFIFLLVLIVPVFLLTRSVVDAIQTVAAHVKEGTSIIPPLPPGIEKWPIVGTRLKSVWDLASTNLAELVRTLAPRIRTALPGLLAVSAGIGVTLLQCLLSTVVAGVLLANAQPALEVTRSFANRVFGEWGPEFLQLVGSTIRSVSFGILGVAVIQSAFATLGFVAVRLPGANLWAVVFLLAAILQMGVAVLIPAVIYVFVIASTTKAVTFLIWCIFVGVMDNVLKPVLMRRGAAVPVLVVFLGAIGGFMAMGIIGLFVGAIVLSVGYKLLLAWLQADDASQPFANEPPVSTLASD